MEVDNTCYRQSRANDAPSLDWVTVMIALRYAPENDRIKEAVSQAHHLEKKIGRGRALKPSRGNLSTISQNEAKDSRLDHILLIRLFPCG